MNIKYTTITCKFILFILLLTTLSFAANSESSIEKIIKERKALFSKNYSTAKKVQAFASKGDFEKSKILMIEMSENYKSLLKYFPQNTKEGFKTEALPTIWENKEEFNNLMIKSSDDMIELAALIKSSDDVRGSLGKLMWSNCKACHNKYRKKH